MADNNNPPEYIPPDPSVIPDPATTMVPAICPISIKCQSESRTTYDPNDPPKRLNCWNLEDNANLYFSCVCLKTNSMIGNPYYSADCALQECVGENERRTFMRQFQEGCALSGGYKLVDIPDGWAPYISSPGPSPSTSTSPSAPPIINTSSRSSTSTQPSTSTQATSALSSSVLSEISTTQSTKTTTNTTASAMPTPTGPADCQIPICGISQKCMTKKPQGEVSCSAGDLDCICKVSNSLEKNTEFDQQCVLDACYGDIGREEFLGSLFYHCKKINKELVDIPKLWEPYLPVTFPSATPAAAPPVDFNDPDSAPAHTPLRLSGGAIGGIVAAAILVSLIFLGLINLWWNTKKKANTLQKDNAKLQDATNPEGMSMRINTLISDSSIPGLASCRDTISAGRGAGPSMYGGASTYNDTTLIGSPRSTTAYPAFGNSATNGGYKGYGANTEDYAMSEYNDDQYTGHGRRYSRDRSRCELPDNERREDPTAPRQENSDDDSVSRYSVRRNSYGDDTVDLQRRREQEATSEWGIAQSNEWTREQEEDRQNRIRRSAR